MGEAVINENTRKFLAPDNSLITQVEGSKERREVAGQLFGAVKKVIEIKVQNWPTAPVIREEDEEGPVGTLPSSMKPLMARAAFRGESFSPERISTVDFEKSGKTKRVRKAILQVLLEASPTVLAFTELQKRALEIICATQNVSSHDMSIRKPPIQVDEVSTFPSVLVYSKDGIYYENTRGKKFMDQQQFAKLYLEALQHTVLPQKDDTIIVDHFRRNPKTMGHLRTNPVLTKLTEDLLLRQASYENTQKDSPSKGVMQMTLVVGTRSVPDVATDLRYTAEKGIFYYSLKDRRFMVLDKKPDNSNQYAPTTWEPETDDF